MKGRDEMSEDITIACIKNHVKKYQIADKLGITESYFSRKLRKLTEEDKKKILDIIDELKTE